MRSTCTWPRCCSVPGPPVRAASPPRAARTTRGAADHADHLPALPRHTCITVATPRPFPRSAPGTSPMANPRQHPSWSTGLSVVRMLRSTTTRRSTSRNLTRQDLARRGRPRHPSAPQPGRLPYPDGRQRAAVPRPATHRLLRPLEQRISAWHPARPGSGRGLWQDRRERRPAQLTNPAPVSTTLENRAIATRRIGLLFERRRHPVDAAASLHRDDGGAPCPCLSDAATPPGEGGGAGRRR